MHYYLDAWKHYATFHGRASRPAYWLFYLLNLVATGILIILDAALGAHGVLAELYNLAVFIPLWAVTVRRLHDTGRSGWNLLWGFLPIVGWVIVIVFLAGNSHPDNRYGPKPAEAA